MNISGKYCGGTGRPSAQDAAREGVLWSVRICDEGGCDGHWEPSAIVQQTDRFVYVDDQGERRRLDRQALEEYGQASSGRSSADKVYCTIAEVQRLVQKLARVRGEERHQGVVEELQAGRRVMEMGSALDFREVAPGIVRMVGGPVYAHDGRKCTCERCHGRGKVGRANCLWCAGEGNRRAIDAYLEQQKLRVTYTTTARDLDEVRADYARFLPHAGEHELLAFATIELSPMLHAVPC